MVGRRSFLYGSALMLAAPLAAEAQPTGKMWRIGFLRGSAPPKSEIEAFRQGLRERGYVEGKNLQGERRKAPIPRG
jgi:putative tryptophan/tyrosine transport system substrate-binding protein